MTMKVEPTGAATGARITGVDLSQELDPDVVASIHKAWKNHQVLIFPDQDLTENEQVRFARLWGEFPKRDRFEARPEKDVADAVARVRPRIRTLEDVHIDLDVKEMPRTSSDGIKTAHGKVSS